MTEVEWSRLKAHELRDLANQDAVVILPVASMEQHGPHLPVQVDSRIAFDVCRAAAQIAAKDQPVALLPSVWTGLSEHHMPFGGTITLDFDTYHALLRGIITSAIRHGFRKILIVNGHGGNIAANKVITQQLSLDTGATIVETTFWMEAGKEVAELLEDQAHVMHACEAETSVMMYLTPDLVDGSNLANLAQLRDSMADPGNKSAAYRWTPFQNDTANGVIGDPSHANAAKGEKLFHVMAEKLAQRIADPQTWAPAKDLRPDAIGGVPFKT